NVPEILLEMIDPRQHVRTVLRETARLLHIAKRQAQEPLAHQRLAGWIHSLVIPPHRRRGGPECFVVEVGKDRIDVTRRVPRQLARDVVTAAMRAPVVAALAVEARRAMRNVAGDLFSDVANVRGAPAGQAIVVPEPD